MRRKNTHKNLIYKTFTVIFQKKVQRTAKSSPLQHILPAKSIRDWG